MVQANRRTRRTRPKDDAGPLELDTGPAVHDIVRIDGETYDLADPQEFGLAQQRMISRELSRVDALEAKPKPTAADQREYRKRLITLLGVVVPGMPPAVRDKLRDAQMADIMIWFFGRAALRSPRLRALRGGTSSPGSPPRTAGIRAPGSTSP